MIGRRILWLAGLALAWFVVPAALVVRTWPPGSIRPIDDSVVAWSDITLQITAMVVLSILVVGPVAGGLVWMHRSRRRRMQHDVGEQQWLLRVIGTVLCVEGIVLLTQSMIWPRFVVNAVSLASGLASLALGLMFVGREFWVEIPKQLTGRVGDGERRTWTPVRILLAMGVAYVAVGVVIAVALTAMSVHPMSVFPKIVVGWPVFVAIHAKRVLPGL